MPEKEQIILPDKYYLDYFNYVLDFVERHYSHVLDQPEYTFYQAFRALSVDAQCLYLRFVNRKGNYFRMKKIYYSEINQIESAKEELHYSAFITINESRDPDQFKLFTKSELNSMFQFFEKSQKKEEMLLQLTEEDVDVIHKEEEIIEVKKNDEVDFIKLLFFGNRYTQMTEFVIRDIGNIKLEQLDESSFKPWFQSREEALGVMHLSQLRRMVRDLMAAEFPLEEYLNDLPWHHWLGYPKSKKSAERLLLEIGAHFERKLQPKEALKYYAFTDKSPSGERRVRLLDKLGATEQAVELAQELVNAPANASEFTFAKDFLNRSGVRINRSTTDRLKSAPSIAVQRTEKKVEDMALIHFINDGWQGVHTENFLWRGLFGLLFWKELFDTQHGSFHHPLQRQPSDLHDATFFEQRSANLEERMNQLKSKKGLLSHVKSIHDQKYGIANRFVYWHESLLPTSEIMIDRLPLKGLKSVMLEMAKNMKENSRGFPDLFLWKANDYQFYEIKSPNDHLSAQQLFWLDFLDSVKIKSDVLRVYFTD